MRESNGTFGGWDDKGGRSRPSVKADGPNVAALLVRIPVFAMELAYEAVVRQRQARGSSHSLSMQAHGGKFTVRNVLLRSPTVAS